MRRAVLTAVFLLALGADGAHAQAHVHGVARLDVALDAGRIEMALQVPVQDLLGFERAPRNDAERTKVEAARRALLDHAALWRFTVAAGCVADVPVLSADGTHDAHDAGHAHEAHADWQVRYRFRCTDPSALRGIEARLFSAFPAVQAIEVQLLDGVSARALRLTPAAPRLVLAP